MKRVQVILMLVLAMAVALYGCEEGIELNVSGEEQTVEDGQMSGRYFNEILDFIEEVEEPRGEQYGLLVEALDNNTKANSSKVVELADRVIAIIEKRKSYKPATEADKITHIYVLEYMASITEENLVIMDALLSSPDEYLTEIKTTSNQTNEKLLELLEVMEQYKPEDTKDDAQ